MHVALAGGIGAARFLRGLVRAVPPSEVTAIVNVGDDIDRYGLHVSPDLDSITYWLAEVIHPVQQWGRADETFTVASELERFGEDRWFTLGDRDLATHVYRTKRLREGATLSTVTAEIVRAFGLDLTLLPATDDPVETRIRTTDGRDLHFQEYWVGERAAPEVAEVTLAGADDAKPAAGVLDAIADAESLLICPSNPVVSIGTILAVPGIRSALVDSPAPVVGISPIVGGSVVRGMADKLLPSTGTEVSALGVARSYADLLDAWIIDERDRDLAPRIRDEVGVEVIVTDTMMDDIAVATALATTAVEAGATVRGGR